MRSELGFRTFLADVTIVYRDTSDTKSMAHKNAQIF